MDLAVLEVPRQIARQRFLEYKEAVTHSNKHRPISDSRLAEMDVEIMRGYREIWRGRQVISLGETFRRGGAELKRHEFRQWRGGRSVAITGYTSLPRLAIGRADQTAVTISRRRDGSATFRPAPSSMGDRKYRTPTRRETVVLPSETLPVCLEGETCEISTYEPNWEAKVPCIPPSLRPRWKLSNYFILWEAEWAKKTAPPPPRDPALLRHIGGDLWTVMATWDLSELERAVLGRF